MASTPTRIDASAQTWDFSPRTTATTGPRAAVGEPGSAASRKIWYLVPQPSPLKAGENLSPTLILTCVTVLGGSLCIVRLLEEIRSFFYSVLGRSPV